MDLTDFWRLIARIDRKALSDGDEGAAIEPLVDALSERSEADIKEFENHLARCLYALDGKDFAEEAGESGESADGFLYTRCYVVACGMEHYESVKADPSKMPKSLDHWLEPLLAVARMSWSEATGKNLDEWDHQAPVSYETGSNREKWQ